MKYLLSSIFLGASLVSNGAVVIHETTPNPLVISADDNSEGGFQFNLSTGEQQVASMMTPDDGFDFTVFNSMGSLLIGLQGDNVEVLNNSGQTIFLDANVSIAPDDIRFENGPFEFFLDEIPVGELSYIGIIEREIDPSNGPTGQVRVGWIELEGGQLVDGLPSEVSVTRWAFETEPNTAITTAVPEPESCLLLGLSMLLLTKRRTRKSM